MKTYLSYVKTQSAWNPCLSNLDKFLSDPNPHRNTSKIATLEFFSGNSRPSPRSIRISQLRSELQDNHRSRSSLAQTQDSTNCAKDVDHKENDLLGRILIVEDLTKEVVEVLGSYLDIDPLFFAGHIHHPWIEISSQTPDMASLPSKMRPEKYFNIHYHRAIEFKEVSMPVRQLLRDANVPRKVMVLPLSQRAQHIGLAQHCTSIFKTTQSDKTWIGLVLVDPPIRGSYLSVSGKNQVLRPIRLASKLFSGGFEDFLDPPSYFDNSERSSILPRDALMESLSYYWTQQIPQCFDPKDPTLLSLSYYPLKLVASEWNSYTALMRHCIKQYEYSNKELPSPLQQLEKLHSDIRDLQS
ncbi:hypothetical protein AOQ84DRAFT_376536 [Glonium stellatum]|uniref:Uncharacterized protein n=1 Tax=Glonium stellatum TaxID=574774 RepID=A0A8E2F159_9PEZI|nr:hypothetical protein AOQ84DRAFT_376536 [Glonium stellatum]